MSDPEKEEIIGKEKRAHWGSKLGIILAVAGSAVGLGNFLRFPVQAAENGGGAFLIPYFISLILLGLPLMWIEWSAGRFGGERGHGTAPGIFSKLGNSRILKYLGILGVFGPIVIFIYYIYIESWLLAYSWFSITGHYSSATSQGALRTFLSGFQGLENNQYFQGLATAYTFFLITFIINMTVVYFGITKGIERLAKIAMPVLLFFGVIVVIRVLTLGTPNPANPEWNILNGMGFLWNPDFSVLTQAKVWLAAAGQTFFTLSVGIGAILTYSSYLNRKDDVALSGLSSAFTNEFAELILGGSMIIPAAFAFFGAAGVQDIAQNGAFDLSFVTMPLIFQQVNFGPFFAFIWFFLLFLAGITSSVSLAQPFITFLQDEFNVKRERAVMILAGLLFVLTQPAIFFLGKGVVDELDFWGGTFALVLFATIETILFVWVFGIDNAWKELHDGAEIKVPLVFKFIMKYVTPVLLLVILFTWLYQDGWQVIMMQKVPPENWWYIFGVRALLVTMFVAIGILIKISWHRKKKLLTSE